MNWRERNNAFLPDPNSPSYRAQVEERREIERQRANRREVGMSKYKTKRGDSVDLPDATRALRDQTKRAYESAVEAFDAIQEAKQRQALLAKTSTAINSRFSAQRGQS